MPTFIRANLKKKYNKSAENNYYFALKDLCLILMSIYFKSKSNNLLNYCTFQEWEDL